MKLTVIGAFALAFASSAFASQPAKHSFERHIRMKGFHGTVTVSELGNNKIEVRTQTGSLTRDVVKGGSLAWVYAHGVRERMYFGHFGESPVPMLIFAVNDANRPRETRAVAFQVTDHGALIGQQVAVDETMLHGHTSDVTIGQYGLTGIDGKLGAIYSVASQVARFEGYFVTYEKLRVRQWDPAISSFIETDCGFLRDRDGRLMQSTRFDAASDAERWDVFASNVEGSQPKMLEEQSATKAIPARAER